MVSIGSLPLEGQLMKTVSKTSGITELRETWTTLSMAVSKTPSEGRKGQRKCLLEEDGRKAHRTGCLQIAF